MLLNMKDSLCKIELKELALLKEKNIYMKANGKMEKCMELGKANGKTKITKLLLNMLESTSME